MHFLPKSVTLSEIGEFSCLNHGFNFSKGKLGRGLFPLVGYKKSISATACLLISSSAFEIFVKKFPNKTAYSHEFESFGIYSRNCLTFSDAMVNPRSPAITPTSTHPVHWCCVKFPMCHYSLAKLDEDSIQLNDSFLSRCRELLGKTFVCRRDMEELWTDFGVVYVHSGVLGVMGYAAVKNGYLSSTVKKEFNKFCSGASPTTMVFNLRVTGGSVADNTIQSLAAASKDWKAWRLIEVEEVRPVWMLLPKEMQEEFKRKTWHVWPHLLNGKPVLRWYQEKSKLYRSMGTLEAVATGDGSYIGEAKRGLPHGIGLKTSADGTCSEGEWTDGTLNGLAQVTSPNGAIYVGYHRNGKNHGHGKYNASDGSVFEGEWSVGAKVSGVLRYVDGSVFEGSFVDDHRSHGTLTGTDGSIYVGGFKDGLRHGQATHTFSNGDVYVGEFAEGKFNGHGRFTVKTTKEVKEGEWKNGVLAHGIPDSEGEEEGKREQEDGEGLGDYMLFVEDVADIVFMVEKSDVKEIESDYEWV